MKPKIINMLPILLSKESAIIFPVRAIAPPVIIADELRSLLVLKLKSPAIVGTINAPEKIVNAINNDWMMDWTPKERNMLSNPIINMMIFVFRRESFSSKPFEIGSLIMVAEVIKAVEPDDMTAESKAAINNPTPQSGKVFCITCIRTEPFWR